MLRRTGFARKTYTAPPAAPLRRVERSGTYESSRVLIGPIAKMEVCRSETYRRLVASLPCIACGIPGHSQAAHPNTGKGAGIKTNDTECFPLCADRPGVRGCHSLFDQGTMFSKAARRAIEPAWGADTRRRIVAMGQWPANLPMWSAST